MHVSGSRSALNRQSERITKDANGDPSGNTGAQSGNGDYVIFDYSDKLGWNKVEEFNFETPGSGTATLLFNNYSGNDGIQVFSGPSKGSEDNLLIESVWGNLRRLTDAERQELRNTFVVSSTGATNHNYANINYDDGANSNSNPKSKRTNQLIGVKYAGAMDFDIPAGSDKYIKVVVPKASMIFDHILKLPNATPTPDNPVTDPNPVVACGQQNSMPAGPGDGTTQPPGSNTSGTGGSTTGGGSTGGNTGGGNAGGSGGSTGGSGNQQNNSASSTASVNPGGSPGGAGGGSAGKNYSTMYGNPIKQQLIDYYRQKGQYPGPNKIPQFNFNTIGQTSGFYRPPRS